MLADHRPHNICMYLIQCEVTHMKGGQFFSNMDLEGEPNNFDEFKEFKMKNKPFERELNL